MNKVGSRPDSPLVLVLFCCWKRLPGACCRPAGLLFFEAAKSDREVVRFGLPLGPHTCSRWRCPKIPAGKTGQRQRERVSGGGSQFEDRLGWAAGQAVEAEFPVPVVLSCQLPRHPS